MVKVIVESHIPYIHGLLEPFAEVSYIEAEDITPEKVRDADALIVRTTVRCNEALLKGSKVRFIASATIGLDHIDQEYCQNHGIKVANAPGCNADAVAQWVFASLKHLQNRLPKKPVLGIVGVGNIGSLVDSWAKNLGIPTLLCDPPREVAGESGFVSLETIAQQADVITFHTPLTKHGPYPTYHLCNKEFIDLLAKKPVIFNASRGAVADNAALLEGVVEGKIAALAIDVWEGEPNISQPLLPKVSIATPHIAGYSLNGKIRASDAVINAIVNHFGWHLKPLNRAPKIKRSVQWDEIDYDIKNDDTLLRAAPQNFTRLRDAYTLR